MVPSTPQLDSSGKLEPTQLQAIVDIPDRSAFAVGAANNGGGTNGIEIESMPVMSTARAGLPARNAPKDRQADRGTMR